MEENIHLANLSILLHKSFLILLILLVCVMGWLQTDLQLCRKDKNGFTWSTDLLMDISFLQVLWTRKLERLLNQVLCLCLHFWFRTCSSQEGDYHIINCGIAWSMDMIMDIISSRDGEESGATVLLTLLIQNLLLSERDDCIINGTNRKQNVFHTISQSHKRRTM